MIDYHYQTFLVLADTLDYAKTAQELCLSKPTITHESHEEYYNTGDDDSGLLRSIFKKLF